MRVVTCKQPWIGLWRRLDGCPVALQLEDTGLPQQKVRVFLPDVRLLGEFDVTAPERYRGYDLHHWVYRHLRDDIVFALSRDSRDRLERLGYVEMDALMKDDRDTS